MQSYIDDGYVPEAVANYLCLLGWSPKDNREKLSLDEVVSLFELDRVNRRNAAFDPDKCFWLNGQYIAQMSLERFRELCLPVLERAGLPVGQFSNAYVDGVLASIKEKIKLLKDVPAWTAYFFTDDFSFDEEAVTKTLRATGAGRAPRATFAARVDAVCPAKHWTHDELETTFKSAGRRGGRENGGVHPSRAGGGTSGRAGRAEFVSPAGVARPGEGRGAPARRRAPTCVRFTRWLTCTIGRAATADAPIPLRLAVIGDPVAHSASPPMHNAALVGDATSMPATRGCTSARRNLPEALRLLPLCSGFLGVNLTIPHKTAALVPPR